MNNISFDNIGLYSAKQRMALSEPDDKGVCSVIPAQESLMGRFLSFVSQFSLLRRANCVQSYVVQKHQQDVSHLERILSFLHETFSNIDKIRFKEAAMEVRCGKPLTARVIQSLIASPEGTTNEGKQVLKDLRPARADEKFEPMLSTNGWRDSVGSDSGYENDSSSYVNAKSWQQSIGRSLPVGRESEFGEDAHIYIDMSPGQSIGRSSPVGREPEFGEDAYIYEDMSLGQSTGRSSSVGRESEFGEDAHIYENMSPGQSIGRSSPAGRESESGEDAHIYIDMSLGQSKGRSSSVGCESEFGEDAHIYEDMSLGQIKGRSSSVGRESEFGEDAHIYENMLPGQSKARSSPVGRESESKFKTLRDFGLKREVRISNTI